MPEISPHKPDNKRADPIIEDEDEEEGEGENDDNDRHGLKHRVSRSSGGGGGGDVDDDRHGLKHRVSRSGGGGGGSGRDGVKEELPPRPPSPPRTTVPPPPRTTVPPPPPPESKGMSWDFFFPEMENVPGPSLAAVDEGKGWHWIYFTIKNNQVMNTRLNYLIRRSKKKVNEVSSEFN